jgi:hypothetical protein
MFLETIANAISSYVSLETDSKNLLPYSQMINFENVQNAIKNPNEYLLINTFPIDLQYCIIRGTVPYQEEERIINEMISRHDVIDKHIIIYGKNANDSKVMQKYKQICSLGLVSVYIYSGGMFEWLMLQDIYGKTEFPTDVFPGNKPNSICTDILFYKSIKRIITNI